MKKPLQGSYPESDTKTFCVDGVLDYPSHVIIKGKNITVDEGEGDVYHGKETSPGHWELTGERFKATLHQVHNEQTLEGSWVEGVDRGMWKIELG